MRGTRLAGEHCRHFHGNGCFIAFTLVVAAWHTRRPFRGRMPQRCTPFNSHQSLPCGLRASALYRMCMMAWTFWVQLLTLPLPSICSCLARADDRAPPRCRPSKLQLLRFSRRKFGLKRTLNSLSLGCLSAGVAVQALC